MARNSKKAGRKLLLKWILALSAVLIGMTVLAVCLKQCQPLSDPEPTLINPIPLDPSPYGQGDFAFNKNGYLTCLAGNSIPGIDVSYHQGSIDWTAVKASGVEFAMIRIGYRGYDSGTLHVDELAEQNLAAAKAAGLKVGAYFFSQAVTMEEAVEEARFALKLLAGRELDLPLAYDWEYVSETARTGNVATQTLMDCIRAFCGEVERAGYESLVYFNQDLFYNKLDLTQLPGDALWLAMYKDQMAFPYKVRFWQYSDEGTVPGIEGNVDLNLYFP